MVESSEIDMLDGRLPGSAKNLNEIPRRVQKLYPAGFEAGIVVLTSILGLKCGHRMPGQSGVFGNIGLAGEMVDWIRTLRG